MLAVVRVLSEPLSRLKIPANREFYWEFCDFRFLPDSASSGMQHKLVLLEFILRTNNAQNIRELFFDNRELKFLFRFRRRKVPIFFVPLSPINASNSYCIVLRRIADVLVLQNGSRTTAAVRSEDHQAISG